MTTTAQGREALEARMGTVMRALAGADDLTTELLWEVDAEGRQLLPPAWFSSESRKVFINASFAIGLVDPWLVNPLTPEGRRKHPHIVGLACHEAAHVRFTRWEVDDLALLAGESSSVREVAQLLEESRIEGRYLGVRPQDRGHLRARFALLDGPQFWPPSLEAQERVGEEWVSRWRAGVLCTLTLARGDAGVLEPEDLTAPRAVLSLVLGDALVELEALWREALQLEDGDMPRLIDVARRWVQVTGEKPRGVAPVLGCSGDAPASAEFADDRLEGDEGDEDDASATYDLDDEGDVLSDLMETLAGEIGSDNDLEAESQTDVESAQDDARARRQQRMRDVREQKVARQKTQDFLRGEGDGSPKLTRADDAKRRDASDEERQLATHLLREIKRARFRERDRLVLLSERPPGRLNGREALLYTAQRATRVPVTARPFRQRMSRHTDEPSLRVGIMTDTSGSMALFWDFATALSWAMAWAVRDVGMSMAVGFGAAVTVLNGPGEVPARPFPLRYSLEAEAEIRGPAEDWKTAFTAIDGGLNLTTGTGAKLLFVLSDGEYRPAQRKAAARSLDTLGRNGVRVIWFAPVREQPGKAPLWKHDAVRMVPVPTKTARTLASSDGQTSTATHRALVDVAVSEIATALRQALRN